jgi:putative DNA methylase
MPPYRKKLIEVALPLEAINKESAREKSIRHGHPSTLHLWWARRPLAACRAVLFASLVDDPSAWPDLFPAEEARQRERKRLFDLIERLIKWENSTNDKALLEAQTEIARSVARSRGDKPPVGATEVRRYLLDHAPPVLDPFCGGGSIPLEAQRLGLRAYASDLNPVAVLITKALIEIPPRFADKPPVFPGAEDEIQRPGRKQKGLAGTASRRGAQGLAEDVRRYGAWMRDQAEARIGHLYPKARVTPEMAKDRPDLKAYVGKELTVIAWLWARTVASPNPACHGAHVPLVRSFWLSTKKGKEAYVEPVIDREHNTYRFEVRVGKPRDGFDPGKGTIGRKGGVCLFSGNPMPFPHIRAEGQAGRMAVRMMAIVAEGSKGRVYLGPIEYGLAEAIHRQVSWKPDAELPNNPRDFKTPNYGMRSFADLFTPRQLVALTTFSDLVIEARAKVFADAQASGNLPNDDRSLDEGGAGPRAYADAVATYLAFAVDKAADYWSSLCSWHSSKLLIRNTFGRQALPMIWDYSEVNPFQMGTGGFTVDWVEKCLLGQVGTTSGVALNLDATGHFSLPGSPAISTDPPYYDNIGYADLSDFFYVWLRRSLGAVYPGLFGTMLTPKSAELIASPYRHDGSREKARDFFEDGLGKAFASMRAIHHGEYPMTVYYAFKQSETDEDDGENGGTAVIASTGWETMLTGLIAAGFSVHGTWPMRTELGNRMVGMGTNSLASSIVLVCRPRPSDAPMATRGQFLSALKAELPPAVAQLQAGNIAPVDLAQASIGPGMAVFTRYGKVLEADGSPMTVRTALALINQVLDETLAEQEGEFDPNTRWALAWFEQFGFEEGPFGTAETLSKAKNVAVDALADAGIVAARAGRVRLVRRDEYKEDWDPSLKDGVTVWEAAHRLILALEKKGETGAGMLLRRLGALGDTARDLAYRLYSVSERKKWAQEGLGYNALVMSWSEIRREAERPRQIETE